MSNKTTNPICATCGVEIVQFDTDRPNFGAIESTTQADGTLKSVYFCLTCAKSSGRRIKRGGLPKAFPC